MADLVLPGPIVFGLLSDHHVNDRGARRLATAILVDGKQAARAELPIIGGD